MYSTQVSYTPTSSVLNVHPQIIQGKSDSVWVKTRTNNPTEIKQAAKSKLEACYGIATDTLELSSQFEY